MNTIRAIDTDYLRPSRTIDTILVSNADTEKVCFVYNYEGYSFRLFYSLLDLINFFQNDEVESDHHFETDEELDSFLLNFSLKE